MRPRKAASLVVSASLCGALLCGAGGEAFAAASDGSRPAAPAAPRTVQDLESLFAACDELIATSFLGIINEDALAKVGEELDTVLGEDSPPGQSPSDFPAGTTRLALKKEVNALVEAASAGDAVKVIASLAQVQKLSQDLLAAVGLGEFVDKQPPLTTPPGDGTDTEPAAQEPQAPALPQLPQPPPTPPTPPNPFTANPFAPNPFAPQTPPPPANPFAPNPFAPKFP